MDASNGITLPLEGADNNSTSRPPGALLPSSIQKPNASSQGLVDARSGVIKVDWTCQNSPPDTPSANGLAGQQKQQLVPANGRSDSHLDSTSGIPQGIVLSQDLDVSGSTGFNSSVSRNSNFPDLLEGSDKANCGYTDSDCGHMPGCKEDTREVQDKLEQNASPVCDDDEALRCATAFTEITINDAKETYLKEAAIGVRHQAIPCTPRQGSPQPTPEGDTSKPDAAREISPVPASVCIFAQSRDVIKPPSVCERRAASPAENATPGQIEDELGDLSFGKVLLERIIEAVECLLLPTVSKLWNNIINWMHLLLPFRNNVVDIEHILYWQNSEYQWSAAQMNALMWLQFNAETRVWSR